MNCPKLLWQDLSLVAISSAGTSRRSLRLGYDLQLLARAVRCVDCQGNGAVDNVIAALDWLAGAYVLPAVASLSLGSNSVNAALDTALQNVIALGVTGIVAAGNYQSGQSAIPLTSNCTVNLAVRASDRIPWR